MASDTQPARGVLPRKRIGSLRRMSSRRGRVPFIARIGTPSGPDGTRPGAYATGVDGDYPTAWPYVIARETTDVDQRSQALSGRELVYPLDLTVLAAYDVSPQAAATSLLARLLSVREWRVAGGFGGRRDLDFVAPVGGDVLMSYDPYDGAWTMYGSPPLAPDRRDWSTTRITAYAYAGPPGQRRIEWSISCFIALGATLPMGGAIGGRTVIGPRIESTLAAHDITWQTNDISQWSMRWASTWIGASPDTAMGVYLCGIPLLYRSVVQSSLVFPAGRLDLFPESLWDTDDWER